jgi:hypothetical protein
MIGVQHSTGLQMFGSNTVIDANRLLKLRSYTVATLPSASASGAGAKAYVTDNDASPVFLAIALNSGAGATKTPVHSDGTNWRIG